MFQHAHVTFLSHFHDNFLRIALSAFKFSEKCQFFIFGFVEMTLNFSALFPCLLLALYDALYMPLLFSVISDGFSLLGTT